MTLPTRPTYQPDEIWAPIVSVFVANVILYFVAQILKDNSIVDITWGLMHVIPNAVVWIINRNTTQSSIACNVLLLVWAVRMGAYNIARHKEEDWRYQNMRKDFSKGGPVAYYFIAYFGIYFVQSIFQLIINCPALFLSIWSTDGMTPQTIVGIVLASVGLLIESLADLQLFYFKKNPANAGQFCKSGLWRYSRHPNYFGEAVFTWGLFIIACTCVNGWITFYSPLVITLLLRFVSGVPLLEKEFEKRPGFAEYCRETNCFFPWFPKSN